MEQPGFKSSYIVPVQKLGVLQDFEKNKDIICFLNDALKSLLICEWFLTKAQRVDAFFLIILLLKGLSRVLGRYAGGTYLPCICCRVKHRTIPEGVRHTLRSECASVWNFWCNPITTFIATFLASRLSFEVR